MREELTPLQDVDRLVQENLELQAQLRDLGEEAERTKQSYCDELDRIELEFQTTMGISKKKEQ